MLFLPKMYQKNIHCIDYDKLYKRGIRCLCFDLDNTISLLSQKEADSLTKKLFQSLSEKFQIAIISNHQSRKRVKNFADNLNCSYIHFALKPCKRSLIKIQKKFSCEKKEICVIGDQLLTDILVANRFGAYSCLVDALSQEDLKITSINRFFEKIILKRYKNFIKKGEYYG